MKLISWNVNGIRSAQAKGFDDYFAEADADVFCLQEIKAMELQVDTGFAKDYHQIWSSAEKKGYSGTALFSKVEPKKTIIGLGIEEHDKEGRIITAEFDDYYVVTVYTPNSQNKQARLPYRMDWDRDFRKHLQKLDKKKPVLCCGDLNVAHEEIDLARPKSNHKTSGFTPQERGSMTEHLKAGFVDSFRHLYPETTEAYSYWSFRANARERNVGWRLDYWLCSERVGDKIQESAIHPDVAGSDHCPVSLEIEI